MTRDIDLELQENRTTLYLLQAVVSTSRIELVHQNARNMNELELLDVPHVTLAQYQHDERFKDILIRIRIFISKYY